MAGCGVLMGGVPGVEPAEVVVIGGGTAGYNAARVASGMGAAVTVFDVNIAKLRSSTRSSGAASAPATHRPTTSKTPSNVPTWSSGPSWCPAPRHRN